MTNSLADVQYWVTHPPRRTVGTGSWEGGCEAMVHVSGGFTNSFSSALIAAQNSGPLDPNHATAQPGEMHYYGGVGGLGHVAWELGGNLLGMASSAVSRNYGWDVGTISWSDYQRIKGLPYLGHTPRHGNQTLANLSPAGGGGTPIDPITQIKESDMYAMVVGTVSGGDMSGAWFGLAPGVLINMTATDGIYAASVCNVDSFSQRGQGAPIAWTASTIQYEARAIAGAPTGTLESLYTGTTKAWFGGGGASTGSFTAADRTALQAIPNSDAVGTALTSTVSLVNQHADTNKDGIIAAIASAPGGAVGDLSITLTGTATQK